MPDLIRAVQEVLPGLVAEYELILVNDGSPDDSWDVVCNLAREHDWIHGIQLMRNYGQHNALLCGVRAAKYEVIVTMDDDLQHPPQEIHKLLEKLGEGYDVVYGSPKRLPHAWWRNLFSAYTKRVLSYVMGIRTVREIGAFRAFRTELRRAFANYQSPSVILDVLLSWGTNRFAVVYVDQAPRKQGHSNYNFSKLFAQAMLILTGFSTAPLRFTSMVGFGFTLFGMLILLYVIGVYFTAGSIPGFPFLASIIALFSGTQLFALGILGEYLARMFERTMDRPPYMIQTTTLSSHPTEDEKGEYLSQAVT